MHSWAATHPQEKMLEQIHFHLTGNEDLETCTKECCISHRKFELSIVEIVSCVCVQYMYVRVGVCTGRCTCVSICMLH